MELKDIALENLEREICDYIIEHRPTFAKRIYSLERSIKVRTYENDNENVYVLLQSDYEDQPTYYMLINKNDIFSVNIYIKLIIKEFAKAIKGEKA